MGTNHDLEAQQQPHYFSIMVVKMQRMRSLRKVHAAEDDADDAEDNHGGHADLHGYGDDRGVVEFDCTAKATTMTKDTPAVVVIHTNCM